jgi:hypothetical protein
MDFPLIGGSAGDGLLDVKDDFELLIQATFNEKCAPEVLAFQTDLLERLQDMVTKQVRAAPTDGWTTALMLM